MVVSPGELELDVGDVRGEAVEPPGELAGNLQTEVRVVGEELLRVADLADHGVGRGRDGRAAALVEEGTDLADERSRRRVTSDDHAAGLDHELALDQDDNGRRGLTLDEEDLARGEPTCGQGLGEGEDVIEHPTIMPPPFPDSAELD